MRAKRFQHNMAKCNQLDPNLSADECRFIFDLIEHKYGRGYTDAEWNGMKVAHFQGKLSILLEMATKREQPEPELPSTGGARNRYRRPARKPE